MDEVDDMVKRLRSLARGERALQANRLPQEEVRRRKVELDDQEKALQRDRAKLRSQCGHLNISRVNRVLATIDDAGIPSREIRNRCDDCGKALE